MSAPSTRIAIVDDEPRLGQVIAMLFEGEGYQATPFQDPVAAVAAIEEGSFDVVVTDIRMDGMDGIEVLRRTRACCPDVPVILLTAYATVATAVAALREGAFDFLEKPFRNPDLLRTVERALELARLDRENRHLRARLADQPEASALPSDVIAHSPAMLGALDLARRAARGRSSVLITGESGTGKEVVARLVHYHSDRVDQPFVAVNCKAFAEGVLESELFGHVKGAFTGASRTKPGLFRRAHGGTLFLDEIGETRPDFQAKLLRVLQERTIRPVGGDEEVPVDVRVVSATNRDLRVEVAEGRFREDLFFRLCVIPVPLEPLRNRREDILPLARHFLARWSKELGVRITGWSADVERHLLEHSWPGNVRELENAIERGVVLTTGEQLELPDLALAAGVLEPRADSDDAATADAANRAPEAPAEAPLQHAIDLATSHHIARALAAAGGKKADAARSLGIDRTTLYRLMRRLGVDA